MNHFETLGLPAQFEQNIDKLGVKYRELARQYHPDNFTTAPKAQQRAALQKSTQINDAYQTLRCPIRRAEHLLLLSGIELKDEQQSLTDNEFLTQQMELRETLAQIEQSANEKEQSANEKALANFSDEINQLFQARLKDLTALLNANAWQEAANSVRKIKFIAKLQTEIERIEERFF